MKFSQAVEMALLTDSHSIRKSCWNEFARLSLTPLTSSNGKLGVGPWVKLYDIMAGAELPESDPKIIGEPVEFFIGNVMDDSDDWEVWEPQGQDIEDV